MALSKGIRGYVFIFSGIVSNIITFFRASNFLYRAPSPPYLLLMGPENTLLSVYFFKFSSIFFLLSASSFFLSCAYLNNILSFWLMSPLGYANWSGSMGVCFVGPSWGFMLSTPPKKAAVAAEKMKTRKMPTDPPLPCCSGNCTEPLICVLGYSPFNADLTALISTLIFSYCCLRASFYSCILLFSFSCSSLLFASLIFSISSSLGGLIFISSAIFCLLSASNLASLS